MLARPLWTLSLVVLVTSLTFSAQAQAEDWPGWRGPRGDGSSLETGVPTEWDGVEGKNIAWKTAIAGSGHSSPIVWGDRVFVASCLPETKERVLGADRKSGALLWQKAVFTANLEGKHSLNSYASPARRRPMAKRCMSRFSRPILPRKTGNRERNPGDLVVAAYDFSGNQKWLARPGRFASVHGFCSSPVLFENLVLINGDHDGESYLAGLDKADRQEGVEDPA